MGWKWSSRCALFLTAAACVLHGERAVAQSSQVESSQSGAEQGVGEIVVTANKREQSVNDVPATIFAVTGDDIREGGAIEFKDLADLTTNVSIVGAYGSGNGNPNIAIRGVGLADFNDNNNSPAGVYVDEVYLVSPAMLAFGLFDLERVEVLKGPQGTLYGRNTTAGAVNLYSSRPGPRFEGDAQLNVEQYGRITMQGGIGGPLSDTLGLRISGTGDFGGGYLRNRVTGTKDNDRNYWALRGLATWSPTETLDVLINIHGGHDTSELGQYQHGGVLDPSELAAGNIAICDAVLAGRFLNNGCVDISGYADTDNDFSSGDYNVKGRSDYRNFGTSLRFDLDLGDAKLTSISAFEQLDGERFDESDSSPAQIVETRFGVRIDQYSQELRLAFGTSATDWVLGAYYGHDTIVGGNDTDVLRFLRPVFATNPGVPASGFLPLGIDPTGVIGANLRSRFRQQTEAVAAFGHVIWEFSPGLKAQAGLRYTSERKSFQTTSSYNETAQDLAAFGLPADGVFLDVPLRRTYSRLTWNAGLTFEPNRDTLIYATASNGFKSGGFPGGILLDAAQAVPYDQERIMAYELGAKIGLWGRNAQVNASIFYYDYSDLQVFTVVNTGSLPVQILTNAADARIFGADIDAQFRLSDNLEFSVGVGLLDTRLLNANIGGVDRSGQRMTNSPAFSFNGVFDYSVPVSNSAQISFQLAARYRSRTLLENQIAPFHQRGYWTIDPRLALGHVDGNWELSIYAKNVFNVRPVVGILSLADFGLSEITVAPPRIFGVGLSGKF